MVLYYDDKKGPHRIIRLVVGCMVQIIAWYLSVLCVIAMAFFPLRPVGKGPVTADGKGVTRTSKVSRMDGWSDGWVEETLYGWSF